MWSITVFAPLLVDEMKRNGAIIAHEKRPPGHSGPLGVNSGPFSRKSGAVSFDFVLYGISETSNVKNVFVSFAAFAMNLLIFNTLRDVLTSLFPRDLG